MSSTKNNSNRLLISSLIICILILATTSIIYFSKNKTAIERDANKEEEIDVLANKMDSLNQKSVADELFINGYYDSAMQVYITTAPHSYSDEFISKRRRIVEQMQDFRLSLLMQVDSAQSQSEFRQSLLEMKTAVMEEEFALRTDSLYQTMKGEINDLQTELNQKNNQLSKSSNLGRLSFYNSKGTKINYFGEVENGKANGEGIGNHATGSVYDGEWKNNQKHGKGTYKWAEGEVYKGEFENDKISGTGTYYWVNGDKYEGEWSNNQRNGIGILYDKDNKVVLNGIWKDDEFVKAVK